MTSTGSEFQERGPSVGLAESIAPTIWEVRRSLTVMGLNLGTRMTVIRLDDGGLFLHSPVGLTAPLRETLDDLGFVRHVVAPNTHHHLFVQNYSTHYPEARFYAAPGLSEKRKDLTFHSVLTDQAPEDWSSAIEQHVFKGTRWFSEVLFFHKATRTLIVTDLLFNVQRPTGVLSRALCFANGMGGGARPSRFMKMHIRDRRAARHSVNHMLAWDPERIVLSHGEIVRFGAKGVIESAFRWL